MADRLPDLIARFAGLKVAVAGDFCLDAYWSLDGEHADTSVETGLRVRRVAAARYGLGGAGNVVANLRGLGVGTVRAIGVHGADPFGAALRAMLADCGADLAGLRDLGPGWLTHVYAKPHVAGQEQSRLDFGSRGALPEPAADALVADLRAAARWADVVVINQQTSGCFADKEIITRINTVIAESPACLFVVDARQAADQYQGAILKVNAREAAAMLGRPDDPPHSDDDAGACARALARRTGRPVVVTRGDRGLVAADGDALHHAHGVEVTRQTDPVGAGDTVTATLTALVGAGADLALAASAANLAAASTVTKVGTTGTVTAADLVRLADDPDYRYGADLADNPARARYADGTEIEVIVPLPPDPRPRHVIFDHDGTLSTLRQGWEGVMAPMMVRAILGSHHDTAGAAVTQQVRAAVDDFVERSTGVQTLVQMVGLVDLVRRFGFVPPEEILDEHGYKAVYNEQLLLGVRRRLAKLAAGQLAPEDFHVKNALPLLRRLRDAGVTLYLTSGTDLADVVAEATALGFAEYFQDRVYGAVGDITVEAKKLVLDRVVREHGLETHGFATFGDGPVEMRETRKRGGIAVGVCSDEIRRYGYNPAKRARLVRGGASILVPDYSDLDAILTVLGLR
ncbi:PfkB family carbohydrate kinase [Phytohabitans sp. ZYX-F-186]|uniref:PfkB family carbohydrate kinase n=1 Tax=Phytohabitans maris TaxID=3071409 RepID=A0ABU0ZW88_9ACTN|nr:PfkB family carbohydrate kinase [Phytohabitans sp. ZYX-F-186]MDQ7911198.1 PfkB family carbohydrate kinase [Phytohabitans sp. ZYX-F-186]